MLNIVGWQHKNIFQVTDEQEKYFAERQLGKSARICMAGNFPDTLMPTGMPGKNPGELKLVSIGLISPMKNILLVLEALIAVGSVQLAESSVGYTIYGPVKDENYWAKCMLLIKNMPSNMVINYHGAIEPSNIVNVLSQNHVFILPSKSENFGHAIYEALSAGRPVITSNNTPWNNLQLAKAGVNVSVDDTAELVKAIQFFAAMSQDELKVWSSSAANYASVAVDLNKIKQQYKTLFQLS